MFRSTAPVHRARTVCCGVVDVGPLMWGRLSPTEQEAVQARFHVRRFTRGHVVFNDGDIGDCLYLVESGRLEVQVGTSGGQMITLRIVQPGDWFGELALVHPDHRRLGRVRALEPTVTRVLHRRDIDALRHDDVPVDQFLVSLLAERVVQMSMLTVDLLLSPETRLWRQLIALAEAYGDDPIRMSQDTFAHTAGTVRQTANRILRIGVLEGVLSVERTEIRVLDRAGLRRLAGSTHPRRPVDRGALVGARVRSPDDR